MKLKIITILLIIVLLSILSYAAFQQLNLANSRYSDDGLYFIIGLDLSIPPTFLDNYKWIDHYNYNVYDPTTDIIWKTIIYIDVNINSTFYDLIINFNNNKEVMVFIKMNDDIRKEYWEILPDCKPVKNTNGDIIGWCEPYWDYNGGNMIPKCVQNDLCN